MVAENRYTFKIIGDDETKRAFASINAQVRKSINLVGQFGAATAAGMAVVVKANIDANTETARLARTVGTSVEALTSWSHATRTVNLEGEKLADIFKDASEKIGEFAQTGGGEAKDIFEKLGLDVREFINLAPDQQILRIGQALDGVQTQSEKIFFLESLASDASRLLPLLENDAELLRELTDEADRLGISITEIDSAKMEMAARSMERVQALGRGIANQVTVELAPIIEVLADSFVGAASEGDRVASVVRRGFTVGAKVAGTFADGVRGVQIGLKGVEVVARVMNAVLVGGFVKLIEIVGDVGNAIVQGIATPIRKILELAAPFSDLAADALVGIDGLLEKIKLEVPASMQAFADAQMEAFDIARGELHALLMEDLPSNVIQANIERVLAEAEARAIERVNEIRENVAVNTGGAATNVEAKEDPESAKVQARLQRLEESYFTELQMLNLKQEQELELLRIGLEMKHLTEEEFRAKRLRAEEKYEAARQALAEKSNQAQQGLTVQAGMQMLSFIGGTSQKMFRAQKAAALAQSLVSLPAAIIDTYKNAGGYPWGIAPAAAMAAKGAAQIASIKSQTLGGGGSVTSPGGGGGGAVAPSVATTTLSPSVGSQFRQNEPEQARTVVNFNIQGDMIGDSGETMLERMRTLIDDNDAILFSPRSRQALELQS